MDNQDADNTKRCLVKLLRNSATRQGSPNRTNRSDKHLHHGDELADTQGGFFMDPKNHEIVAEKIQKYKKIQFKGI